MILLIVAGVLWGLAFISYICWKIFECYFDERPPREVGEVRMSQNCTVREMARRLEARKLEMAHQIINKKNTDTDNESNIDKV